MISMKLMFSDKNYMLFTKQNFMQQRVLLVSVDWLEGLTWIEYKKVIKACILFDKNLINKVDCDNGTII